MIKKINKQFIREHADKEVLDSVLIEFYLVVVKLLEEEMTNQVNPNLQDQTSS